MTCFLPARGDASFHVCILNAEVTNYVVLQLKPTPFHFIELTCQKELANRCFKVR